MNPNALLVSIIVPVYRTELYLDQCVQSLLSQTYRNIEILLIDDGSPDACPLLCEQYAASDSRVRVIHKENGGLSSSREAGIAAAAGDYVMVVDSDDWIDSNTIACCLNRAVTDQADCVMFAYTREYPHASIPNPLFASDFTYHAEESEAKIHRRLVGPLGAELRHPEKVDNLVSVCMKLYKRETVRKGRIVSERIVGTSEDTLFNLYALEGCRISYVNQCFYHYRKANTQSITAQYKADLAEKWDVLYQIFQAYIAESGKAEVYRPAFLNRVACCMIGLGLNEISNQTSLLRKAQRLKEILRKPLYREAFQKLDLSPCPLKWKVFFLFCKRRAGLLLAFLLQIMNSLRSRAVG